MSKLAIEEIYQLTKQIEELKLKKANDLRFIQELGTSDNSFMELSDIVSFLESYIDYIGEDDEPSFISLKDNLVKALNESKTALIKESELHNTVKNFNHSVREEIATKRQKIQSIAEQHNLFQHSLLTFSARKTNNDKNQITNNLLSIMESLSNSNIPYIEYNDSLLFVETGDKRDLYSYIAGNNNIKGFFSICNSEFNLQLLELMVNKK